VPTVFRKYGYRFHFYTNEGNEPRHIHVTGNNGEMKVWLPELSVEFSYGFSPVEQRRIILTIKDNRKLLMEKWDEFAGKKK